MPISMQSPLCSFSKYRLVRFFTAPQARDSMASASSKLRLMALTIRGISMGI